MNAAVFSSAAAGISIFASSGNERSARPSALPKFSARFSVGIGCCTVFALIGTALGICG